MAVLRRNEKLHAWSAMGDIKQKLQENTSGVIAAIQPLYTKCFFFFAGKKNADFFVSKEISFSFQARAFARLQCKCSGWNEYTNAALSLWQLPPIRCGKEATLPPKV